MTLLAMCAGSSILSCEHGGLPTTPRGSGPAHLAFRPSYVVLGAASQTDPINRIRLTARDQRDGTVLGTLVTQVDPNLPGWALTIDLNLTTGDEVPVVITIELVNVAPNGAEAVQWSGQTAPIPVTPGATPQATPVQLFQGPPENLQITSVEVTPRTTAVLEGDSTQISAAITGGTSTSQVFWSTPDPTIVNVVGGRVRGLVPGVGRVIAVAGPRADTARVTVSARAAGVRITPDSGKAESLGNDVVFTGTAVDARGTAVAGAALTWSITDATIAQSLGNGRFHPLANGRTTVTATITGTTLRATAPLIVAQRATRLDVSPGTASIVAIGARQLFAAQARDASGVNVPGLAVRWSSSTPAVATVDETGSARAVGVGTTTITAVSAPTLTPGGFVIQAGDSIVGTATLTVTQSVTSIEVTAPDTLRSVGDSARATARARDANNNEVAGVVFTWTSLLPTVASVDANGFVRAIGNGVAQIRAQVGTISGTADATVAQRTHHVVVTPAASTLIALGQTRAHTASARDARNNVIPGSVFTWSTSAAGVASVDATTGVATAVSNGAATITATTNGVGGTAAITVGQVARSVTVAPAPDSVLVGDSVAYVATVRDSLGAVITGAAVTWSSSNAAIASVNALGRAHGLVVGTTNITAVSGGVSSAAVALRVVVPEVPDPGSPNLFITGLPATPASLREGQVVPLSITITNNGTVTTADSDLRIHVRDAGTNAIIISTTLPFYGLMPGGGLIFDGISQPVSPLIPWPDSIYVELVVDSTNAVAESNEGDNYVRTSNIRIIHLARSVTVTPDHIQLTNLTDHPVLTAVVRDGFNHILTTSPVVWTSNRPGVVTVNATTGALTAVSADTASVFATADGVTARVPVLVTLAPPVLPQLQIVPGSFTFNSLQQALPIVTTVVSSGVPIAATYTFSAPGVVLVQGGNLIALQNGETDVTASATGFQPATVHASVHQVATSIARVSGNGQSANVLVQLAQPLVVLVRDANGVPVANVSVAFRQTTTGDAPGAGFDHPDVFTDASGLASTHWIMPPTPGPKTAQASASVNDVTLTGSPIAFTATALALPQLVIAPGGTILFTSFEETRSITTHVQGFDSDIAVDRYESSNPTVASVENTDGGWRIRSHANGSVTISSIKSGYTTGVATVTVAQVLHHFRVRAVGDGLIGPQTAGTPFNVEVTAQDANSSTVASFTGTVALTASITGSTILATSAPFVGGVRITSVTVPSAGETSITATHTNDVGSFTGTSGTFTVNAGGLHHFLVESSTGGAIPEQVAGVAFGIRVIAQDAGNNTVTGYAGMVTLTSAQAGTGLGSAPAFTNGVLVRTITLTQSGSNSYIRASQVGGGPSNTSETFEVKHAALDHFRVEAYTGPALAVQARVAGVPFDIQITAYDQYDNCVSSFNGGSSRVSITSNRAGVGFPITSAGFDHCVVVQSITLTEPGANSRISVAATSDASKTGQSSLFTVNAGPLHHFTVEAGGGSALGSQTAGTPFAIRVSAKDAANNTVTSFTGLVVISSNRTGIVGLTTTANFVGGVLEGHEVTLTQSGSGATLTATYAGDAGTVTGTSSAFTINAGEAYSIAYATPSNNNQSATVGAQLAAPIRVLVRDEFGNPVAGQRVGFGLVLLCDTCSNGSLENDHAVTDANGIAEMVWTLGTVPRAYTVQASVVLHDSHLSGSPLTFTATALVGALASVTMSPDTLRFASLGETAIVTATAQDAFGNLLLAPTFTSSNIAVATVSSGGTVTAVTNGTVKIYATSGARKDSTIVIVSQVATQLTISPNPVSIGVIGNTLHVTATYLDARDNPVTAGVGAISWAIVGGDGIVDLDIGDIVRAIHAGTARLRATGHFGTTTLVAEAPIQIGS